jgi:hypothetical protein
MKMKKYVFLLAAIIFFVTAGTEKSGLKESYRVGGLAPKVRLMGDNSDLSFVNNKSCYTLLHFWAAYDGNSRKQNVLLWNHLRMNNVPRMKMISVSMDERRSIFEETVKTDGLEATCQMFEQQGKYSMIYRKYGLKKGLGNFLIDDKGVIVAVNVTPETLDRIIH